MSRKLCFDWCWFVFSKWTIKLWMDFAEISKEGAYCDWQQMITFWWWYKTTSGSRNSVNAVFNLRWKSQQVGESELFAEVCALSECLFFFLFNWRSFWHLCSLISFINHPVLEWVHGHLVSSYLKEGVLGRATHVFFVFFMWCLI